VLERSSSRIAGSGGAFSPTWRFLAKDRSGNTDDKNLSAGPANWRFFLFVVHLIGDDESVSSAGGCGFQQAGAEDAGLDADPVFGAVCALS